MTRTIETVDVLNRAAELARTFLDGARSRPVWPSVTDQALRDAIGGRLNDDPMPALGALEMLARLEPGIVTTVGPRYFGFVTGGALPGTVGAEWLTTVWDQSAGLYVISPAGSIVEDVVAGWLLDLLALPASASVGFVTGCHMANFTALAAARHEMLRRAGWDVEADGLNGSPALRVIVGGEVHVSVLGALRMLGFGTRQAIRVDADGQGRMRPEALEKALGAGAGPAIVCAQAGNVNTGAFDPIGQIADVVRRHGAWLHIDGAFGLWACASSSLASHLRGVDRADSWATDAHKWLNVPYDSGIVVVAHPAAHRAAMSLNASYLVRAPGEPREPMDYVPESSRRARGFSVYVALRELGRRGLESMIDRCCRLARRFADLLRAEPGVYVLNDVVLNQVLVRVGSNTPDADADAATQQVIRLVQDERVCWAGPTRWHEMDAMRISVSNWSTTEEDVDRSVESILRCVRRQI